MTGISEVVSRQRSSISATSARGARICDRFGGLIVDTGPLGKHSDISPWVVLRNDQVEEAYS